MPEGSSSDAPVIRPGPRVLPRRFSEFFSARSSAALGSTGRLGSTRGSPVLAAAVRSGTDSSPPLCASFPTAAQAQYVSSDLELFVADCQDPASVVLATDPRKDPPNVDARYAGDRKRDPIRDHLR